MENATLIKNIKEAFGEILPGASSGVVKASIDSIVRSINRLRTKQNDLNLRLRMVSADVLKLFTSQVAYSELKNKQENPGLHVKAEFDATFFESLDILKSELFSLLERLRSFQKNPPFRGPEIHK